MLWCIRYAISIFSKISIFLPTVQSMGSRVINSDFQDVFLSCYRRNIALFQKCFIYSDFFLSIVHLFNGIPALFFSFRRLWLPKNRYGSNRLRGKKKRKTVFLNVFLYDLINTHTHILPPIHGKPVENPGAYTSVSGCAPLSDSNKF